MSQGGAHVLYSFVDKTDHVSSSMMVTVMPSTISLPPQDVDGDLES